MPRPTDESIMDRFLAELTNRGGSAGNYAMRDTLELSDGEYWRIRNKLLDDGKITLGRGRGGSVNLVRDEPTAPPAPVAPTVNVDTAVKAAPRDPYATEADLYSACLGVLQTDWSKVQRLFDFQAELTAQQGSRKTGGIWTRPDIAGVSVRMFPYWPGRHYDLWTFEIKPRWSFNVVGLFEALAHARAATHSWALYHVDQDILDNELDVERMTSEAQRLGVGLIMFTDPADFATWDIRVTSVRTHPDPALHDEFVKTQFSDSTRELLLQWSK